MSKRAEVSTPWIGDGLTQATAYRPLICDAFPGLIYEDITAQPSANLAPAPNLYNAIIECDDAVLAQIESDNRFFVWWSEDVQ